MALKKSKEDINVRMFYALRVSEESRVPFLFISAPGMGKSTTVEMFAKLRGYKLQMLRGNSTSPEEVMGYDTVKEGHSTAVHLRPTWYQQMLENQAQGMKTLLFLDEITTCPSHVQAALLHLVLERRVGMEDIPEDTLIVSAGNYAQSLGSTFDLLAPLMNRFCIFNVVPEPSDIRMFLSKYEGAAAGKMVDVLAEKLEVLKKFDDNKVTLDEASKNKIAEYIEHGIVDCVDQLMNSGQKVVDFKVTDLQGIYRDNDNDNTLKGFITPRTLCFLRDATISAYMAFGKTGVTGNNYHLLVEGLCGLGLSRKSDGVVVATEISKDFEQQMKVVVTEIDKMNNNKLPIYNQFFVDLLKGCRDKKDNVVLTNEAILTLSSKLKEMLKDKDIADIERPLESKHLEDIITGAKIYLGALSNFNIDHTGTKKISDVVSVEQLAGAISQWNTCAVLCSTLKDMVKNSRLGYTSATQTIVDEAIEKANKYSFSMSIIIRWMQQHVTEAKSLLPELDTKFLQ